MYTQLEYSPLLYETSVGTMVFIETPAFTRLLGKYLDDDGYRELQESLATNPMAGSVISGTGGFRKLRWRQPGRQKGTRGGIRLIYYYLEQDAQLWFVTLYGKDEADDLSANQKRTLRAAIAEEKQARRKVKGRP